MSGADREPFRILDVEADQQARATRIFDPEAQLVAKQAALRTRAAGPRLVTRPATIVAAGRTSLKIVPCTRPTASASAGSTR